MATIDLNDEKLFELVTDALRAGPGSPQWHQAVTLLGDGASNGDEQALLYAAREHLESGREYRSVRPGPKFTRKVMEEIDKEEAGGGGRKPGLSVANIVTIVAVIVMVSVIGLILYFTLPSGKGAQVELEQLKETYFVHPAVASKFDSAIGGEWITIGSLPVGPGNGLHSAAPTAKQDEYQGGGIVSMSPVPASEPFAVEAVIVAGAAGEDEVMQLFVTDRPDFTKDRGMSFHEIAWAVQGRAGKFVGVDGQSAGQIVGINTAGVPMTIRISVGSNVASVDVDGKTVWYGEHYLANDRPRYLGVRFMRKGGAGQKPGEIKVQQLRVLKEQK